jgi:protein SCO1/2
MTRMARRLVAGVAGVAVLALTACEPSAPAPIYHARDITGVMRPLAFQLVDGTGAAVTAANYRGKIVLVFFGYTHCPDVCPTTLAKLTQVLKRLGPTADSVRVLFVSVDPARDSPKLLKSYAAAFAPQFVGLTGSDAQLTEVTKRYRVAYRREKPDPNGEYAVYHSSAIFIFDISGNARLLATGTESVADLTQDLRALADHLAPG